MLKIYKLLLRGFFCMPAHAKLLLMVALSGTHLGWAQQVPNLSLVKNVNAVNLGSNPAELTDVNGVLYFKTDWGTPYLSKSSGTTNGTARIDKWLNSDFADLKNVTDVNGNIFFVTRDFNQGWSIWKSDGSADGSVLVRAFNTRSDNLYAPSELLNVNGTLFFVAYTEDNGLNLWKSDGTTEGTKMVKPIANGGSAAYNLTRLVSMNDIVYYAATTPNNGFELWRSDGTEAGTYLVKDIVVGQTGSSPNSLHVMGNTLYFAAGNYQGLWKSDGTDQGTVEVSSEVRNITHIFSHQNTLYIAGRDAMNALGTELWKSDGTGPGTAMVSDIASGTNSSSPSGFVVANGVVFFVATDAANSGTELWRTDGTPNGTAMVIDIVQGTGSSSPSALTSFNNRLYFTATSTAHGREVWATDGTLAGTQVADLVPGATGSQPAELTVSDNKLFFAADSPTLGRELWVVNQSFNDTQTIDVRGDAGGVGFFSNKPLGNVRFFAGNDGIHGSELWKTDGTEQGTVMVKDLVPGPANSNPATWVELNGAVYFIAGATPATRKLWKTDGTEAGTTPVKDIPQGGVLRTANGLLFFRAYDDTYGVELWKSDGTEAGTVRVADVNPGGGGSLPFLLGYFSQHYYFQAYRPDVGTELWRTDGTEAGTELVADVNAGTPSSHPGSFYIFNNQLFFRAQDEAQNTQLWVTDGTPGGTTRFGPTNIAETVTFEDKMYFVRTSEQGVGELWTSDGTTEGTVLIKALNGFEGAYVFQKTSRFLYFTSWRSIGGASYWEEGLWRTDGTADGTTQVWQSSTATEYFQNTYVHNDAVYFIVLNGENNQVTELWKTDGYACSTFRLFNSSEYRLVDLVFSQGSNIYSRVETTRNGRELYAYNTSNDPSKCGQQITFDVLSNKHYGDAPYALTATSSSQLQVTYTSSNTDVATINGSTLTIVGVGQTTITASQAGNQQFNPAASVERTLLVDKGAQTITFEDLPLKSYGDAAFNLAATASSNLPVVYSSSNEGVATISGNQVSIVGVGTATITASQSGNHLYNPAQVGQTLVVNKGTQAINFAELGQKTFGDAPFQLSATLSSNLPVSYASSNTDVATISGNQITIVGAGMATISAFNPGNHLYNAVEVGRPLMVTKAVQTISFAELAPKTFGDASFELVASVSSPLPITYSSSNTAVATVAQGRVTILGAGTTTITASQGGNSNYAPAEVARILTVRQRAQTISFAPLEERIFGEAPFELAATASSGLIVTYSSSNTNVAIVNGSVVTIVGPGTTVIRAAQSGNNDNAAATPIEQTLTVLLPTGLEPAWDEQVKIYPNPVAEEFVLSTIHGRDGEAVTITDTTGKMVAVRKLQATASGNFLVDVRELQPGYYLLHIGKGGAKIVKRFVKL
jgi:ELWxxDGT repeat protein